MSESVLVRVGFSVRSCRMVLASTSVKLGSAHRWSAGNVCQNRACLVGVAGSYRMS